MEGSLEKKQKDELLKALSDKGRKDGKRKREKKDAGKGTEEEMAALFS